MSCSEHEKEIERLVAAQEVREALNALNQAINEAHKRGLHVKVNPIDITHMGSPVPEVLINLEIFSHKDY